MELNHVTGGADTPAVPSTLIPESFATLYEQTVIGWTRGDDVVVGPGRIIYVCPDNSTVVAMVEDLAKWRRRQGYVADVVTTAEAGTTNTAIRSWLSSQYVAAQYIPGAAPLEFVVLVGDGQQLPSYSGAYEGANDDTKYVRLDGTDVYPDALISRISAQNATDVETQVVKLVTYERDIAGAADWTHKATGIASNEGSPSDIQRANWLPADLPLPTQVKLLRAIQEKTVRPVGAASEEAVDLVVIATHGRSGLSHAILGSTAEKVVRKAPCPGFQISPFPAIIAFIASKPLTTIPGRYAGGKAAQYFLSRLSSSRIQ